MRGAGSRVGQCADSSPNAAGENRAATYGGMGTGVGVLSLCEVKSFGKAHGSLP